MAANENTSLRDEIPNISTVLSHLLAPQSNRLQPPPCALGAPIPTQTIAARTVFHEAQAAIRPLIAGIQTQEQLDTLLDSLQEI